MYNFRHNNLTFFTSLLSVTVCLQGFWDSCLSDAHTGAPQKQCRTECARVTFASVKLAPPLSLPSVRKRVTVPHSSVEGQVVESLSPKMVNLGDVFPEFAAVTNEGKISFHEWLGGS